MAWADAHDQIVTAVKAVTPTTRKLGLPGSFRHVPEGWVSQGLPDSRSFFVDLVGPLAMWGHVHPVLPRNSRYECDLVVLYRKPQSMTELQKALAADHIALVTALADQVNWGQPTSTIERLYMADGDLFGVAEVETIEVDNDLAAVLVRQHLTVDCKNS